jgi:pyruvate dehydrogenase E1 component alpha subunit
MTLANDAPVARLAAHYRTMRRIRDFEELAEAAAKDGLVKGATHLSIGQAAMASGVCAQLRRVDMIVSTQRGPFLEALNWARRASRSPTRRRSRTRPE